MPDFDKESKYNYAWDTFLAKGYREVRKKVKGKRSMKEWGTVVEPSANCKDSDPIIVTWPDGHCWEVADMTVGDWKEQGAPRDRAGKNAKVYWEGTLDKKELKVCLRKNLEDNLISLQVKDFEAEKPKWRQIVQCDVKHVKDWDTAIK